MSEYDLDYIAHVKASSLQVIDDSMRNAEWPPCRPIARWGCGELADATAKVSTKHWSPAFERGEELRERTVDAIRTALEAAGVEFTNGASAGREVEGDP